MQSALNLIDAALRGEIYFDQFAEDIQKLGVESIALDMVKGVHTFYAADKQVFDHALLANQTFDSADTFDKDGVIKAIAAFDKRDVTASEFHKALAAAGVSFARCYFKGNRAIYLSPNGEFYVEQW